MPTRMGLLGTPGQVGRRYGRQVGPLLRSRVRSIEQQAEKQGFLIGDLVRRAHQLRSILERVAPRWLEELGGVAAASGLSLDGLLIVNSLPGDFWRSGSGEGARDLFPSDNCTSALAVGSSCQRGEVLLHKNRDKENLPQSVFVRGLTGTHRYLAGTDIGNLGIAHFLNEKGLAGANNTGSRIGVDTDLVGLNDCHILRLFAERASTCEDALAIMDSLIHRGSCGTSGYQRGMIFLLADPEKGLVIESTPSDFSYRWVRNGTVVRTNHFLLPAMKKMALKEKRKNASLQGSKKRYERARGQLSSARGKVTPERFRTLSRDTANRPDSICRDDPRHSFMTVSAFTHVLKKKHPGILSFSWVANGNPRNTYYFPVFACQKESWDCLVKGRHYLAADECCRLKARGVRLRKKQRAREKNNASQLKKAYTRAVKLLARKDPEAAIIALGEINSAVESTLKAALL